MLKELLCNKNKLKKDKNKSKYVYDEKFNEVLIFIKKERKKSLTK